MAVDVSVPRCFSLSLRADGRIDSMSHHTRTGIPHPARKPPSQLPLNRPAPPLVGSGSHRTSRNTLSTDVHCSLSSPRLVIPLDLVVPYLFTRLIVRTLVLIFQHPSHASTTTTLHDESYPYAVLDIHLPDSCAHPFPFLTHSHQSLIDSCSLPQIAPSPLSLSPLCLLRFLARRVSLSHCTIKHNLAFPVVDCTHTPRKLISYLIRKAPVGARSCPEWEEGGESCWDGGWCRCVSCGCETRKKESRGQQEWEGPLRGRNQAQALSCTILFRHLHPPCRSGQ